MAKTTLECRMTNVIGKRYVLVTAAYNEEKYIENLIKSVVAQTYKPVCWVIVSDNSSDHTDEIVKSYAGEYEWIRLHRNAEDHPRNFAAQVNAINAGLSCLKGLEYEFVGNLDADISLLPCHFDRLLEKFRENPRLGLGGSYLYEESGGQFKFRKGNSPNSVAHGVQLFRRECLTAIGGKYVPLPYGGPDTHAEVMARMKGWNVCAFPDLRAYHHRPTGTGEGRLRCCLRQGLMDYSLGFHPLFEILRVLARIPRKPYLFGSCFRLYSFLSATLHGENRPVSDEFVRYSQREQLRRLWPFGPDSRARREKSEPI
jgi:poly-beta-1,6-N-acetyl-D-glucosamine synthase